VKQQDWTPSPHHHSTWWTTSSGLQTKTTQQTMIPQPNKIDIEQQDPLDPHENLQLAQHSDVQAAAFATLGIGLLVPAVFLFIVLVTAITPTIIHLAWLLGLWLLALTTPWLTLAYLHARRIFWHDRHQRKLFHLSLIHISEPTRPY